MLKGAKGLLKTRQGHTELGLALAREAETQPAVVVCEMLNGQTGQALQRGQAQAYADANGLYFLRGRDIRDQLG